MGARRCVILLPSIAIDLALIRSEEHEIDARHPPHLVIVTRGRSPGYFTMYTGDESVALHSMFIEEDDRIVYLRFSRLFHVHCLSVLAAPLPHRGGKLYGTMGSGVAGVCYSEVHHALGLDAGPTVP